MTVQGLLGEVFDLVYVLLFNDFALVAVVQVAPGNGRRDTNEDEPIP